MEGGGGGGGDGSGSAMAESVTKRRALRKGRFSRLPEPRVTLSNTLAGLDVLKEVCHVRRAGFFVSSAAEPAVRAAARALRIHTLICFLMTGLRLDDRRASLPSFAVALLVPCRRSRRAPRSRSAAAAARRPSPSRRRAARRFRMSSKRTASSRRYRPRRSCRRSTASSCRSTSQEGQEVQHGTGAVPHRSAAVPERLRPGGRGARARQRVTGANAQRERDRYKKLLDAKVITPEEGGRSSRRPQTAEATLRADRASVAHGEVQSRQHDHSRADRRQDGQPARQARQSGALGRRDAARRDQPGAPDLVRFSIPSSQLGLMLQYGAQRRSSVRRCRRRRAASPSIDSLAAGDGAAVDAMAARSKVAVATAMQARWHATARTGGPAEVAACGEAGGGRGGAVAALAATAAWLRSTAALRSQDDVGDRDGQAVVHRQRGRYDHGHRAAQGDVRQRERRLWAGPVRATSLRLFDRGQTRSSCRTQAVVTGQRGTYVYVIDQSDTARQRAVIVERTAGRPRRHRERHS